MNTSISNLDGWITLAEYAELAGIKPETARKNAASGRVVATKLSRTWYVNLTAEIDKGRNQIGEKTRRRHRRRTFP